MHYNITLLRTLLLSSVLDLIRTRRLTSFVHKGASLLGLLSQCHVYTYLLLCLLYTSFITELLCIHPEHIIAPQGDFVIFTCYHSDDTPASAVVILIDQEQITEPDVRINGSTVKVYAFKGNARTIKCIAGEEQSRNAVLKIQGMYNLCLKTT